MSELLTDDVVVTSPTPASRAAATWARWVLAVLVAFGLLVDLALQSHIDGLAMVLAVGVLTVGLLLLGGIERTGAQLCIALAPAFGAWLAFRTSPWLVPFDLAAAALLLALGVAPLSRPRAHGFAAMARRVGAAVGALVYVPAFAGGLGQLAGSTDANHAARRRVALRAAAVGIPLLVVLGMLLASADAVLASYLTPPVSPGSLAWHGILLVLAALAGTVAFVAAAGSRRRLDDPPAPSTIGFEAVLVLGGVAALYAFFVATQWLVAVRGEAYVLETTGLTYAEHARSGFFQLLFVAAITLVVLLWSSARLEAGDARLVRWFRVVALVSIALTLVIVWVSIDRLLLYEDAFGLTMLRLSSTIFAAWIGLLLVLVAGALVWPRHRALLARAFLTLALVVLFAVNLVNPEQIVVERNLDRYEDGAQLDVGYLSQLSADAVPALVDGLEHSDLDPAYVRLVLCDAQYHRGVADANRSASAADEALAGYCAG